MKISSDSKRALGPRALALLVGVWMSAGVFAAETGSLNEHLEWLRPFLGRTWRGELKNSKPGQPQIDVSRWERALNGQAVRILHSINDGVYGGETMVFWDAAKKEVTYHYFTTAGYVTRGTMRLEGDRIVSREAVEGEAGGVTEVRATSQIRSDGTLQVKSEYLKQGTWVPGHEIAYREAPEAKVTFR